ncbi:MAG TPA: 2Fe-2S iron-sulfur cluster-binding protein, partial [Phenylobacterium sp.]|nr:2Fe-2S iron-sulfur cluster-binding protein [Phenylobacterium sp.]
MPVQGLGDLGVFGARFGCGLGQCGACAVMVDGRVEAACTLSAASAEGRTVVTVEGLGTPERPHPLQAAFLELQAGQCGYCLSGILIGAKALLDANP